MMLIDWKKIVVEMIVIEQSQKWCKAMYIIIDEQSHSLLFMKLLKVLIGI